ncbi:ribosomal DNA transcription factor [Pseudozyma hubeiensis SY62]|uniref:Ribosomal DNA transcription factor n=1 Tax=Pseudozyma hubeiensis (strain SY62) TaxID=1305764 RepID=R9P4U6_PSEHS|nr:ribosomal DNA transcription factor [Pseudozyma hubeiensis SY62]GAC96361.1 ribosomal DNA transcription factor [Pseudozyma hubeiensis SY62]
MGSVFSCLASTFIYLGEFLENVFLAIGEIGAVLVRAIIGIVVSLCDLLAAISCCYRVPWSERPDRSFYTYSTNTTTMVASSNSALATVGGKQVLSSVFTKEGREQRKQIKAARIKAAALKAEQVAAARDAKKAEGDAQKKAAGTEKKGESAITVKA